MALTPHGVREYLAEELTFPIESDEVVEHVGDQRIEAPDVEASESIGELLAGVGADRYESADELNQQLHAMLPDEYIGRKYYDDRGGAPARDDGPGDDGNQSF